MQGFYFGLFLGLLIHELFAVGFTNYSFETDKASERQPSNTTSRLIAESCNPDFVPDDYKKLFGPNIEKYTPFHEYFAKLYDCTSCPVVNKWIPYFEAYHEQFNHYRNQKVVLMEIGVQSGGSISMWRKYFGSGLQYIGLDINPEVQRFDQADWVNIHVGDSGNATFLSTIRSLYPGGVDIVLDDGGHTMEQQITMFQSMGDFVKSDGIYACEDLSTSYSKIFGGIPGGSIKDQIFRDTTMLGRIMHAIDWLHAGFREGDVMAQKPSYLDRSNNLLPEFPEYKKFLRDFKSIHVYNQIVFFKRGSYSQARILTKGKRVVDVSQTYSGYKLPWKQVDQEIDRILAGNKTCQQ